MVELHKFAKRENASRISMAIPHVPPLFPGGQRTSQGKVTARRTNLIVETYEEMRREKQCGLCQNGTGI